MIFVQRILADVKTLVVVIGHRIDNARMILEAGFDLQSPNSGLCSYEGTVDADQLHVLLAVWENVQMLDYENDIHDF